MKDPTAKTKNGSIAEIAGAGFVWLDVRRPTHTTLKEVQKRVRHLRDEDLEDCLPPFERPKLVEREHYLFVVLLYPVFDPVRRVVRPTEVDFFIGRDFLVMSHEGVLPEINRITQRRAVGVSPARLVIELAHEITVSRYPLLTDISNELLEIENRLFAEENGSFIRDILRVRNSILAFRETMQGHATVFRRLATHGGELFNHEDVKNDCDELIEHVDDIWSVLANDKETAEALYDSHLSLVTMKTNQAMRTLTVLSFLILPMTLVATVFTMRTEGMPLVNSPHAFYAVLAIIFTVMLGLLAFIKGKKLM
jgi:magnesium transporter